MSGLANPAGIIIRPGISGWAQVNQGHVAGVEEVHRKLQYDFYYIKYFSPWLDLLILFRTSQGVALGGSWDGLPSLLALNAPKHRRGWYAMLGQLGAPAGFIVAAALFAFLYSSLSNADFYDWGWRYPFFAAFAIDVVALFSRLRIVVTHEYEQ